MRNYTGLVRHAGNDSLFRAIEMSLVSTLNGQPLHLHAEGVRGTGKTTVMRAARSIMPAIRIIKGCLYNCHPKHPHCPHHRDLSPRELEELGWDMVPMPFLEISPSAKVGTVVGSIDLSRVVNQGRPEVALLPGTIPQAHRGILFVDEINRLADIAPELADVLLDVMGTRPGRLQIEETGLPRVEIPVVVSVWAASNPDEEPGPLEDIRRQLADRFDLTIVMNRPSHQEVVLEILERADAHLVSPWWPGAGPRNVQRVGEAGLAEPGGGTDIERKKQELSSRRGMLVQVRMPESLRRLVASLYTEFSLESLRAVETLQVSGKLSALLQGRQLVSIHDLLAVAPLVLSHRVDLQSLPKVIRFLEAWQQREGIAGAAGTDPGHGSGSWEGPGRKGAHPEGVAEPGEGTAGAGAGDRSAAGGTAPPPAPSLFNSLSRALARLRGLGLGGQLPGGGAGPGGGSPAAASGHQHHHDHGQGGRAPAGEGRTGPGGAGGSARAQDPLTAPLTAPPLPARHLFDLRAEEVLMRQEES